MQLTQIQKKVIASVQLQADAPIKVIAAETGLPEHTIRHCLDSLKSRGYLFSMPCIDVSRLGFVDTGLYFSLGIQNENARQRMISFVKNNESISWFAELCGEFQYAAVIYTRKMKEIDYFLKMLTVECGVRFFNKAMATRVSWTAFRSKHLARGISGMQSLTFGHRPQDMNLDEVDHAILSKMASSPNLNQAAIARALSLPLTTVNYRVRNLEESGVIAGYSYRLRGRPFGLSKFRFLIYQEYKRHAFQDALFNFCADHPNITYFAHCVGSWDYELSVEVEDPGAVPIITQQLHEGFAEDITSVKVQMVLNHLKTSFFPFMPRAVARAGNA